MPTDEDRVTEKPSPPPELAVILPDGRKVRIDPDVVQRERLGAGMKTPFSQLPIVLLKDTGAR
jgi:hypothetical protein